jgi:hypothetical protein
VGLGWCCGGVDVHVGVGVGVVGFVESGDVVNDIVMEEVIVVKLNSNNSSHLNRGTLDV